MTIWSPDTCGCVVELSDPDAVPVRQISVCDRHAATAVDHNGVLAENQNKNRAVNAIADAYPAAVPTSTILPCAYDAQNRLTITIPKVIGPNAVTVAQKVQQAGATAIIVVSPT